MSVALRWFSNKNTLQKINPRGISIFQAHLLSVMNILIKSGESGCVLETSKKTHSKRNSSMPIAYSTRAIYAHPDKIAADKKAIFKETLEVLMASRVIRKENTCRARLAIIGW